MLHPLLHHQRPSGKPSNRTHYPSKAKAAVMFSPQIQPAIKGTRLFTKPKINQPGDRLEREADALAEKIVLGQSAISFQHGSVSAGLQRKCAHCMEEDRPRSIRRKENDSAGGNTVSASFLARLQANSGSTLPTQTQQTMERSFGSNFSQVRVHTGSQAENLSNEINARAFTYGNDIFFNRGEFNPGSTEGKKLLAHELTHVVQQSNLPDSPVQRAVFRGTDHAGNFTLNDDSCAFHYAQDWYFNFPTSMDATRQIAYMAAAEHQVESVWANQHKIKPPAGSTCPCATEGIDVAVDLVTHREARNGRHGYDAAVTDAPTTGLTTQPLRDVDLNSGHDTPVDMGGLTQQRIAHEFGHTLGITDEYHGWASLFSFAGALGSSDRSSIMHSGDNVRPRHYQHFADLINEQLTQCTYSPENIETHSLRNPLVSLVVNPLLNLSNADFVMDIQLVRRMGTNALLGMATPSLGFSGMFETRTSNFMFGPTIGLNLNRLAHPLYVDIRTGVLYDPSETDRGHSLNLLVPSLSVGLRGNGFSAGIHSTGLYDVLGSRGYTHLVGIHLAFDL